MHLLPLKGKRPPWRELLGQAMVDSFPVIKPVYIESKKIKTLLLSEHWIGV